MAELIGFVLAILIYLWLSGVFSGENQNNQKFGDGKTVTTLKIMLTIRQIGIINRKVVDEYASRNVSIVRIKRCCKRRTCSWWCKTKRNTTALDSNGNVTCIGRTGKYYVNGEETYRWTQEDKYGNRHDLTIGVNSGKVYRDNFDDEVKRMSANDEKINNGA